MSKDKNNFPSWVNTKKKSAKVVNMGDIAYQHNFFKNDFIKANKPRLSNSSMGTQHGEGDYVNNQNYLYSLGATHPLMVHVREREILISNVSNTNFLNYLDKSED